MVWSFSFSVCKASLTMQVKFRINHIHFQVIYVFFDFIYLELLRNMMGLLGNVAECQHLRHRLMKPEYIQRFILLLDSESDGIEVSYNAAGILSHIGEYLFL